MILFASGRTDIVAFYTKWFINRYREGYVDVRNPFYNSLVSRIYFEDVDLLYFCTKNPLPIIPYLKEFDKPILFNVTITPYKNDVEVNVPNKSLIIEGVKKIAEIIGKENVYVRYDPIFLSERYNLNYHIKAFERLCSLLDGVTNHIIISFIDDYKNVRKNMNSLKIIPFTKNDYREIGINFSKIARKYNISCQTCFERENLTEYGFVKEDCLSKKMAYALTGKTYRKGRMRKEKLCNCVEMVDIGSYNSCRHLCKYCYANYDESKVLENFQNHDVNSSLLIGKLSDTDIIKVRKK